MYNTIILLGSASEGFTPIGPFSGNTQEESNQNADTFGNNSLGDNSWEIMDLTTGEQYVQNNGAVAVASGDEGDEDEEDEEDDEEDEE